MSNSKPVSSEQTAKCPKCGYEQNEQLQITEHGVSYACLNEDCRVSAFYGYERWPEEESHE